MVKYHDAHNIMCAR